MALLPSLDAVRTSGDPILRARAVEVPRPSAGVDILVARMWDVMARYGGVGLAANQIGVSVALFVADTTVGRLEVANPSIEVVGDERVTDIEGCLSVPGEMIEVSRPFAVRLLGRDAHTWDEIDLVVSGLDARIVCHETDHLMGRLITDGVAADPVRPRRRMRPTRA